MKLIRRRHSPATLSNFCSLLILLVCLLSNGGYQWSVAVAEESSDPELEADDEDLLEDLVFEEEHSGKNRGAGFTAGQLTQNTELRAEQSDSADLYENLRWTIDLSSRGIVDTRVQKLRGIQAIGLDFHKVFTRGTKDWGTLVAQLYFTRIDRLRARPYFFDDAHDSELVVRIFNFNFTALFDGRFNIRAGHFDIPYGLEYSINTNGTLRQFLTVANLGLKNDFGLTVNGVLKYFEYEIALSRGTWNEYYARNEPFIYSGRIGSGRENNLIAGLSGFYGEVAGPSPTGTLIRDRLSQQLARRTTIRRWRLGLDFQYYWNRFGVIGETSYGLDGSRSDRSGRGQQKWNSLVELSWQADPFLQIYTQYRAFYTKVPRAQSVDVTNLTTGLRWTPVVWKPRSETNWAFSIQGTQSLSTANHSPRSLSLSLQFRVRI